jgi:phosphoribosylaminoimidazolecarboxamide formyltransferase/IMP cyclohydrolase
MPRALLSVYDKTGLIDFASGLQALGWSLLASGGTASLLRAYGILVTEVSDYTGSPEILKGRVKTLHPAIHGGILARPDPVDKAQLVQFGWDYIDLVAVNLYPFTEVINRENVKLEEAIENIDIGGVALIRAAAKNFERVILVCDSSDYTYIIEEIRNQSMTVQRRRQLAVKGFATTFLYDRSIYRFLAQTTNDELILFPVQKLRYGENPHQEGILYSYTPGDGPLGGKVLQGKELSYNNLLDLDAAWRSIVQFERPTICIVKHLSPCGIASSDTLRQAYQLAFECDPISAFGGIIASNRPVDLETAEAIQDLFVECIIAPKFQPDALPVLAKKKNCRLVEMPDVKIEPGFEIRSINRGILKQSIDAGDPTKAEWKVVSKRQPSQDEWRSLEFAWKACQTVKSNAIVFAIGEMTVGIGSGQPNRVDSVRIASAKAGTKAKGAVMASDAFFPFPDSITVAAEAGITAVIHPGGSLRDQESIDAANQAGLAMVVTGFRHFRH